MTFRRIHTDRVAGFCVFRTDHTLEYVLYVVLPEKDWPEMAIRLSAGEVAMFLHHPGDFSSFANDFIASHHLPIYSSRKISFRNLTADLIEVV